MAAVAAAAAPSPPSLEVRPRSVLHQQGRVVGIKGTKAQVQGTQQVAWKPGCRWVNSEFQHLQRGLCCTLKWKCLGPTRPKREPLVRRSRQVVPGALGLVVRLIRFQGICKELGFSEESKNLRPRKSYCLSVYVHLYMCISIYIYVYTYTYRYMYMYMHMCVCMYTCRHIHI